VGSLIERRVQERESSREFKKERESSREREREFKRERVQESSREKREIRLFCGGGMLEDEEESVVEFQGLVGLRQPERRKEREEVIGLVFEVWIHLHGPSTGLSRFDWD